MIQRCHSMVYMQVAYPRGWDVQTIIPDERFQYPERFFPFIFRCMVSKTRSILWCGLLKTTSVSSQLVWNNVNSRLALLITYSFVNTFTALRYPRCNGKDCTDTNYPQERISETLKREQNKMEMKNMQPQITRSLCNLLLIVVRLAEIKKKHDLCLMTWSKNWELLEGKNGEGDGFWQEDPDNLIFQIIILHKL